MNIRRWAARVVAMGSMLIVTAGSAGEMKWKGYRRDAEEELKEKLEQGNSRCGTKVKGRIEWADFKDEAIFNRSVSGYCGAFDAMDIMCWKEDAKAAIAEQVKEVVCRYGGKGKKSVSLKKGILTVFIDFEGSNTALFVQQYLEKVL